MQILCTYSLFWDIQVFYQFFSGLSKTPISSQVLSLFMEMASINRNGRMHVLSVLETIHVEMRQDILKPVEFQTGQFVVFSEELSIHLRRNILLVKILFYIVMKNTLSSLQTHSTK